MVTQNRNYHFKNKNTQLYKILTSTEGSFDKLPQSVSPIIVSNIDLGYVYVNLGTSSIALVTHVDGLHNKTKILSIFILVISISGRNY